ncbi:MAG: hypothetical protein JW940_03360 [Polyangiaceae bacterium]|nr:hypothetical protein [Polyangiaceae bacterium]
MKEPLRWLDASEPTPGARMLRAVVDEPLPDGALERAGKRLGVSATLLGVTSAGMASAAAASSATAGASAGASVLGSSALVAAVAKSIVVGVGVAATITGGMHWAAQSRKSSSAPATLSTPTASAPASAPVPPRTRVVEPRGPGAPVPALAPSTPNGVALPEQAARATLRTPTIALMPGSDASAPVHVDDSSWAPGASAASAAADTSGTGRVPAGTETHSGDSTLAREVRLLDDVRRALRQGNAALALDRLDQGKELGVIRLLDHEASMLRVEALVHAGRRAEAAALARRLLARGVSPSQKRALESWASSEQ